MIRLRFATLAVAAGLGLSCGCLSLSHHPILDRFRSHDTSAPDCCDLGGAPGGEGPIVDGFGTATPPGVYETTPRPRVAPQTSMPPLASPPPTATELQSQPKSYSPTK